MSVGTPFTARLFVCAFLFGRLWEDLLLHFFLELPSFFIHFAELCLALMIRKSPFNNSLICEILRLGWNCLNSPINFLQFRNPLLAPLRMVGIMLLCMVWDVQGFLEVAGKSLAWKHR